MLPVKATSSTQGQKPWQTRRPASPAHQSTSPHAPGAADAKKPGVGTAGQDPSFSANSPPAPSNKKAGTKLFPRSLAEVRAQAPELAGYLRDGSLRMADLFEGINALVSPVPDKRLPVAQQKELKETFGRLVYERTALEEHANIRTFAHVDATELYEKGQTFCEDISGFEDILEKSYSEWASRAQRKAYAAEIAPGLTVEQRERLKSFVARAETVDRRSYVLGSPLFTQLAIGIAAPGIVASIAIGISVCVAEFMTAGLAMNIMLGVHAFLWSASILAVVPITSLVLWSVWHHFSPWGGSR